jgi:hypothetical protein
METWDYTCNQSPDQAFNTVRFHVRKKVLELGGGVALNGEGIDLDFIGFDGVARVRFAKTKDGTRVSVSVPDGLRDKVSALFAALIRKQKLRPFAKAAEIPVERKTFTPAIDILRQYLANPDFSKHVEILPAALVHAEDCLYEHDGKLGKALTNLGNFAAKRVGKNIPVHRLANLARDTALGSVYRPMVSETVVRVHGDHYRFEYQGRRQIFSEHITLGGGYPKECMSIHFLWDETRAKLVIGYFGEHLPTSLDK